MEKTPLELVALCLEQKVEQLLEVHAQTRHLEQALDEENRLACKEALTLRGHAMEKARLQDEEILQVLRRQRQWDVAGVMDMVRGKNSRYRGQGEFAQIQALADKSKVVWQKSVERDRAISLRIGGKSSVYQGLDTPVQGVKVSAGGQAKTTG